MRFLLPLGCTIQRSVLAVTTAAVLLLAHTPAEAQGGGDGERAWQVSPFLGVAFGGNLENSPATGGVSFGLGGHGLGFEGEIARLHAEQGFPTAFETNVWSYALNALYDFDTQHAFIPYALVGIVWQRANADLSNVPGGPFDIDDTTTKASFNTGVGLKAMLTSNAGLRVELRYTNGKDLAPDFWRVSAGFLWRFGRR